MSSERQLLNKNDPWWGEHLHRYNQVLPYVKKTDNIIDIACGTGFGSAILAGGTEGKVTGGDINEIAIEECRKNWQKNNLEFRILDGTNLPFPNDFFNIVVSFETIEHTDQYKKMIEELARVLKTDGIAFISTPNFPVNSPSGKVINPYHTQEFTYDELDSILKEVFSEATIMGQKYSRYDGNDKKSGKIIEWFFNIIGIRKLPYKIKTGVSKFFTGKPFYPTENDFTMVSEMKMILRCKTFFCICRK
jgi:ubiquinone/menaquinone biosynthesis C-methylase UbiE